MPRPFQIHNSLSHSAIMCTSVIIHWTHIQTYVTTPRSDEVPLSSSINTIRSRMGHRIDNPRTFCNRKGTRRSGQNS
jgi:hypothetical protein